MSVRCSTTPRAFSLIEILVSIIILGLGLLGLGALFPVVIRQQRISTDQTIGVMVGDAAKAKIVSGAFNDMNPTPPTEFGGDKATAWMLFGTVAPPRIAGTRAEPWGLARGYRWNNFYDQDPPANISSAQQPFENGEWATGLTLGSDLDALRGLKTGATAIGDSRVNTRLNAITLADRLYPSDSETPQFGWDIAVQRVSDGIKGSPPDRDALRVAIFVRRIDQRIRVTGDNTLRQVLLAENGLATADQRSPFGEDARGQPTFDGTDGDGNYAYSQIKVAPVEFHDDPTSRNRLYVNPANVNADTFAIMKQPNQRLIDNLGNIYTVISSGTEPGVGPERYIRVEPPIPASITSRQQAGTGDAEAIRQVCFTSQVPVYVTTVRVLEPRQ